MFLLTKNKIKILLLHRGRIIFFAVDEEVCGCNHICKLEFEETNKDVEFFNNIIYVLELPACQALQTLTRQ